MVRHRFWFLHTLEEAEFMKWMSRAIKRGAPAEEVHRHVDHYYLSQVGLFSILQEKRQPRSQEDRPSPPTRPRPAADTDPSTPGKRGDRPGAVRA